MFRSNPFIDRFIQFFSLPRYCFKATKFNGNNRSLFATAIDMLDLFFNYKTFPDHYLSCRLFEVARSEWQYYYGSNYHPYQRARLRRRVQQEKYRIVFNDKSVCGHLCKCAGISVPHTYGIITPDENYKRKIIAWCRESPTGALMIKPIYGRAGLGIVLARKVNNDVEIKSPQNIRSIQDYELLGECVVQEVVMQDERMAVFSQHSVNTVRVITMFTRNGVVIILGALLRMGVGEGYVDNFSAGGIAVGIDIGSGKLRTHAVDKRGNVYDTHPNTKIVFGDLFVPEWRSIIEVAERVQRTFCFYGLLGVDIALQASGSPIVIEINAAPDITGMEQKSGPLLKNARALQAFGEYNLLVNRHQRRLLSNLRSCDSE